MRASKAVVPAAGLGTRFLPATKAQPKEMLPVVDKPAIHYIAEEVIASVGWNRSQSTDGPPRHPAARLAGSWSTDVPALLRRSSRATISSG